MGFPPLIYAASVGEFSVLKMLLGAVTLLLEQPIDDEPNDWLAEVLETIKEFEDTSTDLEVTTTSKVILTAPPPTRSAST